MIVAAATEATRKAGAMTIEHRAVHIDVYADDVKRRVWVDVSQMGTGRRARVLHTISTDSDFTNEELEQVRHLAASLAVRWMTKLAGWNQLVF